LSNDPATRDLPIIVATSMQVNAALTARLPPGAAVLPKDRVSREQVIDLLQHVAGV
jgi:hypothetical protein